MATDNGNRRNGSGNIITIVQLSGIAVLILGMFGFWWQSADPKARLDRIEAIQADNRKELNEALARLRTEGGDKFVNQSQYKDLEDKVEINRQLISDVRKESNENTAKLRTEVSDRFGQLNPRITGDVAELRKNFEDFKNIAMSKYDFSIWKSERDKENTYIHHRIDEIYGSIKDIQNHIYELTSKGHGK